MQIQKNKNYQPIVSSLAIDLVCGMEIDTKDVKFTADYKGDVYYFCAVHCKNHFVLDPVKYVGF